MVLVAAFLALAASMRSVAAFCAGVRFFFLVFFMARTDAALPGAWLRFFDLVLAPFLAALLRLVFFFARVFAPFLAARDRTAFFDARVLAAFFAARERDALVDFFATFFRRVGLREVLLLFFFLAIFCPFRMCRWYAMAMPSQRRVALEPPLQTRQAMVSPVIRVGSGAELGRETSGATGRRRSGRHGAVGRLAGRRGRSRRRSSLLGFAGCVAASADEPVHGV